MKSDGGVFGGSVSLLRSQLQNPCVAALGLSSGITSPKRGFGGGDGESSPEPLWVSILRVLLSCLEVMKGQESFSKCVDSCTLCLESQCTKTEDESRSLAPSPGCIRMLRWDKRWDVAKMAPNPSDCRVGSRRSGDEGAG